MLYKLLCHIIGYLMVLQVFCYQEKLYLIILNWFQIWLVIWKHVMQLIKLPVHQCNCTKILLECILQQKFQMKMYLLVLNLEMLWYILYLQMLASQVPFINTAIVLISVKVLLICQISNKDIGEINMKDFYQ